MSKYLSLAQAAEKLGLTRQAVWRAIRFNKLNSVKINGSHNIEPIELEAYLQRKYDKRFSTYNGEPLFRENEYSAKELAKFIGCDIQRIYYLSKFKKIPYTRKGAAYIFTLNSLKMAQALITSKSTPIARRKSN